MSNTSNASKNVRRFLLLFALGIAYGFMYVMPYMKSSFYDQMIAASRKRNFCISKTHDKNTLSPFWGNRVFFIIQQLNIL